MTHWNPELHRNDATFSLDATPLKLRLSPGAAVFAVRGQVWITQERMADDIVLVAGQRFDVRGREPLLLSAIKESAVVLVVAPEEARISSGRDLYDVMRARAAQLRRDELTHLTHAIQDGIAMLLTRTRGLFAARERVPASRSSLA